MNAYELTAEEQRLDRLARRGKGFKKTRKPKTGSGAWNTASGKTGALPRSGGSRRPLPEYLYLFSQEEWQSINPIDREEVKQVIVALSLWTDAAGIPSLFPQYDWSRENVTTRLKLILWGFDRELLPEVDTLCVDDRSDQVVYYIRQHINCQNIMVYDQVTLIPALISRDRLFPNF